MKKMIIALATGCMLSTTLLASPAHAWGWGNHNNSCANNYSSYYPTTGWRGTVNRVSSGLIGYAPFNYANNNCNYNYGNYGYNPYYNNYGRTGLVQGILNRIF